MLYLATIMTPTQHAKEYLGARVVGFRDCDRRPRVLGQQGARLQFNTRVLPITQPLDRLVFDYSVFV